MDEIVKKVAGLGLPGIFLVLATAAAGGVGNTAAVVSAIMALGGPFGLIGGLGVLGLAASVGDVIAGYGIEAVLMSIYKERSKTESVRFLLKELKDLPISEELKAKLKNELLAVNVPGVEEVEPPRTIDIVDEE